MAAQIVQCEVRWVITVGYSGNELPPSKWTQLGDADTEEEARKILTSAGFTSQLGGWRDSTGYGTGYISRVLREIREENE